MDEKKSFMAAMGWRVRSRREALKMSQEELAFKLHYKNKASISRIESGLNEIPQSKMKSFAVALDTSIEYLMGWEDMPPIREPSFTKEEIDLILCYRRANQRDRDLVDLALSRYKEDTALSVG